MIVGIPQETFPGETRVALNPGQHSGFGQGRNGSPRAVGGGSSRRISRFPLCRQGGQGRLLARRGLRRRRDPAGPRRGRQSRGGQGRSGQALCRQDRHRIVRSLGAAEGQPGIRRQRGDAFRPGAFASHHAGPGHGRALVAGHDCRLSGRALGRPGIAQDLPHADHGGRNAQRGEGLHRRRRRGRFAGDCHRPAARRGRVGLRRPPRGQGADHQPGRQGGRNAAGHLGQRGQGRLRPGHGRGLRQETAGVHGSSRWPAATW